MRAYLFTGVFVAFVAFICFTATPQTAEAGAVIPESGSSGAETEALPGLPSYTVPEDEEAARKRMRRQQQPPSTAPRQTGGQQGGTGAGISTAPAQMPLPPTYAPGAPASYNQPASAAMLPVSPTSQGLYNSPMAPGGGSGFGLPGQPGNMSTQPGGMVMPPSPTDQGPMAFSPGTTTDQQIYGPHSPSGISQSAAPQMPVASRQSAGMPSSGAKPFQDYKRTSPYSPYMNLSRTQDMDRGINNYYNLVRPALEQSQENSRVRRSINTLQNTSRNQGMSLQQINQQNQARQRPGNVIPGADVQQRMPATYMNVQQYYPGLQ